MSPGPSISFHHFGLAVTAPDRALAHLGRLGYRAGERIADPLQRVELVWCEHDAMPAVELVVPSDPEGPLRSVLAASSSSFYHLCYEVGSAEATLAAWRRDGARVVTVREPLPAVLFGGRPVSFHVVQGFGLVELLEATP